MTSVFDWDDQVVVAIVQAVYDTSDNLMGVFMVECDLWSKSQVLLSSNPSDDSERSVG